MVVRGGRPWRWSRGGGPVVVVSWWWSRGGGPVVVVRGGGPVVVVVVVRGGRSWWWSRGGGPVVVVRGGGQWWWAVVVVPWWWSMLVVPWWWSRGGGPVAVVPWWWSRGGGLVLVVPWWSGMPPSYIQEEPGGLGVMHLSCWQTSQNGEVWEGPRLRRVSLFILCVIVSMYMFIDMFLFPKQFYCWGPKFV